MLRSILPMTVPGAVVVVAPVANVVTSVHVVAVVAAVAV